MLQDSYLNSPEVTVLLCAFNAEKFIRESIDSILDQTYQNFELLVIDDASTDRTQEIIEKISDNRIRVIKNKRNIGLTKSLNVGLKEAKGIFIARQDADDISEINRLKNQVEYLRENSDIGIVGGQYTLIDKNSKKIDTLVISKPSGLDALRIYLAIDNPFVHGAVTFRKAEIEQLGGYNEEFITNQDIELWSRALRKYKGFNLTCKVMRLRVHDESVSAGKYKSLVDKERLKTIERVNLLMKSNLDLLINKEDNNDFINGFTSLFNNEFKKLHKERYVIDKKFRELKKICKNGSSKDLKIVSQMIASKYIHMGKYYQENRKYYGAARMILMALKYDSMFTYKFLFLQIKSRIKNCFQ